jgi:outer membrane protein assembly factor BamB
MPVLRSVAVLLACVSLTQAADWPQWRGPNRDGHSPETGLLEIWPEGGPKRLWEAKGIGRGYSSMASVGGKVYTVGDTSSAASDADEYLVCLDGATGKTLWRTKLGKPYQHRNKQWESSRSTPTVDGDRLYVLTGTGDLVCLDAAGGKERWRKSLVRDFGGKKGDGWGYSESVLIEGDTVICTPGGKTTMAALNKRTGATVWTAALPAQPGAGHASAVVAPVGTTRVVVQTTAGYGLGVRASDGKVLWTVDGIKATAVIPTPVVRGDQVLFAAGYNTGGTLVRQVPKGDGVAVETVYPLTRTLANKHGGLVLVGDYVYGDSEDRGMPICVEFATGKEMWKKRGAGGSMSVIAADGHLYLHYASGTVVLAKASPTDYTVVGSFKVPPASGRPGWAHPILADGKLYIRGDDVVRCYAVSAGRSD